MREIGNVRHELLIFFAEGNHIQSHVLRIELPYFFSRNGPTKSVGQNIGRTIFRALWIRIERRMRNKSTESRDFGGRRIVLVQFLKRIRSVFPMAVANQTSDFEQSDVAALVGIQ